MLQIITTPEGKQQVAVEAKGFAINEPFLSECGRFTVDPYREYGIEPKLAELLDALNRHLRGERAESELDEDELAQQQYAAHGFGACPQCGFEHPQGHQIQVDGKTAFQEVTCDFCGAAWSDEYHLGGYTLTEPGRFDEEDAEVMDERYADKVLVNAQSAEAFEGIEIEGVRLEDEDDPTSVVIDNDEPEFFSVYLRHRDGHSVCVGDHSTVKLARAYAQSLASQYGWPVTE